ncbi:SusE domain-containing protein [Niabella aquatica]
MRKNIHILNWILLVMVALASCKKDERTLNVELTPVSTLAAPADKSNIKLNPTTGGNIIFQWSAASTPDSGVILYEVAFDKMDGNFSNPVYKIVADGGGLQTTAGILQKDLNKIAALAGIESSSSGQLKWAVRATKAANVILSSQTYSLTLERPAGFAVLPEALYITGTATESGDDITKAIQLKKTADGNYELYTSLKAGSYFLTDKPGEGGTPYYMDENNIIKEGNSTTTVTGDTRAYRLNYDFNIALASQTAIDSIGLFMSAYNTSIGTLNYAGNSTWEAAKIPVEFYQFSWGRDERYKFILHTSNGKEYMGSSNVNNIAPAGQPASYFYLWPVNNAQWDNTYKFDPSADRANIKATLYFQPNSSYKHVITKL